MNESTVTFSTLSFAGSELFAKRYKRLYHTVVIDEAAQVRETGDEWRGDDEGQVLPLSMIPTNSKRKKKLSL